MYFMGHSIPTQLKIEVIQKSIFWGRAPQILKKIWMAKCKKNNKHNKINIKVNPNNSTRSEVEVIISEFDEKWCDGSYMYIRVFH